VFTQRKFTEKLRYIHRNLIKRGLVELPEQWRWSSYRSYAYGEEGPVKIGYDQVPKICLTPTQEVRQL
jgi:putative transposase